MFKKFKIKINTLNTRFKGCKVHRLIVIILIISGICTITSYAYYVKYISITNDLSFKTGSLIVNLGDNVNEATKSIKINNMKPGTYGKDSFKVKNNGTLNAKIKLMFSVPGTKDKELLNNFKCVITFEKGTEKYREVKDTFFNLINNTNGFEFINDKGIMILKPGEEVKCDFTAYLDDTIDLKYENSKTNFSVTVKATQT